jgi:hypothetical protein
MQATQGENTRVELYMELLLGRTREGTKEENKRTWT